MVYDWKRAMPVKAQEVGEYLDELELEFGKVTPKIVLDRSREEDALLHSCFEWNDDVAAEKYRETQAGFIIRNLVIKVDNSAQEEQSVRAFVNVKSETQSIFVSMAKVIENDDLRSQMLNTAKQELHSFKQKYENLQELCEVFKAIDKL
jgi:hypothetical protein